jgi:hypothetical protein
MEKYLCWFAHREPYVPYKTIVEMMTMSISSSRNVHEVVDDNRNPYRNMTMNTMRMNQGRANEYPIANKEPNVDSSMFLIF